MKRDLKKDPFIIPIKRIIKAILFIVFFLIQIFIYYILIFGVYNAYGYPWFDKFYLLIVLISFIFVLKIYNNDMNISYKLTWTILILVVPIFGITIYTFYGNGKLIPNKKNKEIRKYIGNKITYNNPNKLLNTNDSTTYKLIKGITNSSGYPYYDDSKIEFFSDTTLKHERVLNDLKSAKKYIFLDFFIVSNGSLLDELIEVLKIKGKEGVKIYFIYDDVGSKLSLKSSTIKKIKEIDNLYLKSFSPIDYKFNPVANYRDHRKIIVVDGKIAYTGGDNLADEYVHKKEKYGKWRDNSIRIEGNAAKSFVYLFLELWYMSSEEILDINPFLEIEQVSYKTNSYIQPFGDGPTYKSNPAHSLFLNMISSANKKIYISTPYFIIDKGFINNIVRAIKSGVEVIILLPHIPDKKTVFYITRSHYGEILKAGGKIYEYSEGFNHAKNVIVDSKYAYVGSSNFDYRSFYLSFECGVFFAHDDAIIDMEKDFLSTLTNSEEINYEKWKRRPLYQKLIGFFLSFISPLL